MVYQILKKFGKKPGFFGDQKGELTIKKPNFLKNTLVYCNQVTTLPLKAGDYAIYLDYVILRQIILEDISPPDLDNYVLKENEVILHVPLYTLELGILEVLKSSWHF